MRALGEARGVAMALLLSCSGAPFTVGPLDAADDGVGVDVDGTALDSAADGPVDGGLDARRPDDARPERSAADVGVLEGGAVDVDAAPVDGGHADAGDPTLAACCKVEGSGGLCCVNPGVGASACGPGNFFCGGLSCPSACSVGEACAYDTTTQPDGDVIHPDPGTVFRCP